MISDYECEAPQMNTEVAILRIGMFATVRNRCGAPLPLRRPRINEPYTGRSPKPHVYQRLIMNPNLHSSQAYFSTCPLARFRLDWCGLQSPSHNTACLKLPNIAERKNDQYEETVAVSPYAEWILQHSPA